MSSNSLACKHIKVSIPEQLKTDEFRFNALIGRTKRPVEKDYHHKNYKWDDAALGHLFHNGNNYGILAGFGDLAMVDADKEPLISDIKRKTPKTFTTKSPHGSGIHKIFKIKGGVITTQALLDTIEDKEGNRKNIGHIRGDSGYVVGPGCLVYDCPKCGALDTDIEGTRQHIKCKKCGFEGNGVEMSYTVFDDSPIAEITKEELLRAVAVYRKKGASNSDAGDSSGGETEYVFTLEKYQSILDIIPNKDEFVGDGVTFRGTHGGPAEDGRTDYLVVNAAANMWYCNAHSSAGNIFHLIAVQEGILRCVDCGKGSLKGDNFRKVRKIAYEKYGIEFKRGEHQQSPKSDIQLHDVRHYLILKEKKDGTEEVAGIKHKLFADDLILWGQNEVGFLGY